MQQHVALRASAPPRYSGSHSLDRAAHRFYKSRVLKQIFTWWTGATVGARWQITRSSRFVGDDDTGNKYYESVAPKFNYDGRNRRFVIYNGYPDASKVPPEWHGWLHHTTPEPPTRAPLKRRSWEKDHEPNLTGTIWAWRPKGSLSRGGKRQAAAGDYQPWTPD
jgi:NADH:ubiquinone oxidoreductase subunit